MPSQSVISESCHEDNEDEGEEGNPAMSAGKNSPISVTKVCTCIYM